MLAVYLREICCHPLHLPVKNIFPFVAFTCEKKLYCRLLFLHVKKCFVICCVFLWKNMSSVKFICEKIYCHLLQVSLKRVSSTHWTLAEAGDDCTYRDCFVYVLSQWETTLQCNVSHGLDTHRKWSLYLWGFFYQQSILLFDEIPKSLGIVIYKIFGRFTVYNRSVRWQIS